MLDLIYTIFLLFMLVQGVVNLFLTLYVWEKPERVDQTASPKEFSKPQLSFTVLLPARHEENVIGRTIESIATANYPRHLLQILVVCDDGDTSTIEAAKEAIDQRRIENASVLTYSGAPINKPHGLNTGLAQATGEVTAVFDAEDEVSPDIFNVANTLYVTKKPDVIQAGVQLMNYDSRWFSSHNVLEYYFWFRSRMHFHTRIGMVPLGGNTVFFVTRQLLDAGGWDEKCLTEDAEIGVRLSVNGARVISTYDPQHITKEETPLTVSDFIKQRTRWNQGFIQVLSKKSWTQYDTLGKRLLCFYTLAFPFTQTILTVVALLSIMMGLEFKIPVLLSLLSFSPLLIVLTQIGLNCLGLHEFTREQNVRLKWWVPIWMISTFFAYQALLGISAMRASYRQVIGRHNWEKTTHAGQHRAEEAVRVEEPVGVA